MENISLVHKSRALDTVLLGRPVTVFDAIAHSLGQQITEHIQNTGHRRIALSMQEAQFNPARSAPQSAEPHAAITLSRQTVQDLMAERYGFSSPTRPALDTDCAISTTEARITSHLLQAIRSAVTQKLPEVAESTTTQLWQWQALIQVGSAPAQPLHIHLPATASASLERLVAQQRRPLRATPTSAEPLMIDLHAVLAHKHMTAADVQQLRVGSIVPIPMERAKVSLNGQAMLSASVAEHHGILHLTAFENLD